MGQLKKHLKVGYFTTSNVFETVTPEKYESIEKALSLSEILKIIGKNFFVMLRCSSLVRPGTFLEGTRLTVTDRPPEGFEFTIRTSVFPARFKLFEALKFLGRSKITQITDIL